MENFIQTNASGTINDVQSERITTSQPPLLSKKAQKRAGLEIMSKGSVADNNDGDKDSEESVDSWKSQHLQRQVKALEIRIENGQFSTDERMVQLEENMQRMFKQMEISMANLFHSSQGPKGGPVKDSSKTRDSNFDSQKEESLSGDVFGNDEFVIPILGDHEVQDDSVEEEELKRQASRTMLDGPLDMSDLLRMGSHGKSRYNANDEFRGEMSSIKKVNFPEAREREFRYEEKGRGFRAKGGARAPSIEHQPEARYNGPHPLHHPYSHSGDFPRHRLELFQGPDYDKLPGLKLENDSADSVSKWMRKVENVQALHPGTRLPIWALLSEGMQLRVRALWWDEHKRSLDGNTQFLDLQELITLLRNSFYPRSVVMFVDLFRRLVGEEHLKLMPSNYQPAYQNLQPMVRMINALAGNVSHALAVILGDQVRAKRDISANVLPALDYRGSEDASAPGFMRIWCSFLPLKFGRYIHDKLSLHADFRRLETYEDYITLWLRFFDAERKFSEEVVANNATMRFYTGGNSHKTSETNSDSASAFKANHRGTGSSGQEASTPKRFFPQKFIKARPGVSSVHEAEEEGNDENLEDESDMLDETMCEEIDRLCAVQPGNKSTHSRPSTSHSSIQARPSTLQRPQTDNKAPGVGVCFVFTRTGVCEARNCNYSHDVSLARKQWHSLADQLAASPHADKNYKPKVPNVPPFVPPKSVNMMDGPDRTQTEDFAMRYYMRSSSSPENLGSIAQGFLNDELPKNTSQSFASSPAREDY